MRIPAEIRPLIEPGCPGHLFTLILLVLILAVVACGFQGTAVTPSAAAGGPTGLRELDAIVSAATSGESGALLPYFEFAQLHCTTELGLGGPPKCLPGEHDGTPVSVMPFLGPGEGSFIRELDTPTWELPSIKSLYAAYKVADSAYSDKNYPAGDYALVFVTIEEPPGSITLQVTNGRIVRIDFGLSSPPQIPADVVETYVVPPP